MSKWLFRRFKQISLTSPTYNTETRVEFFDKADKSIPFRIVGTYEYRKALEALDRLVAQSTTEQIAVYDNMLYDRPEFSFCRGVDSRGAGQVSGAGQAADAQWLDPYMRRGLP